MKYYCKVRGVWTTAISDFDTTCRFWSANNCCRKKERCKYKTKNPLALFVGKTVKAINCNNLIFSDGSIQETK